MRNTLVTTRPARAAVLAAVAILAACSDENDPVRPDPTVDAEAFRRLVVSDTQNFVRIYDLASGAKVDSMGGLPGRVSYLYTAQGRVAAAHFRAQNRLAFIDGGVREENGAGVKEAARVIGWHDDLLPTHGNTNGGFLTAWADGSGQARFWRESSVAGGTLAPTFTVNTGAAHHGAAMALGDGQLVAASIKNPSGTGPNGIYVYSAGGQVVDSTRSCPGLHGLAGHSTAALFGCSDGPMLVTHTGGRATFAKVTNPADARFGVGTVYAREGQPRFLVRMTIPGAAPASTENRVMGVVDPATRTMQPITIGELDFTADIDWSGRWALILGRSGTLYVADMTTRQVVGSLPNALAAYPASGTVLTPFFSHAEGVTYVSSPTRGEVLEIALAANGTPSITRRIATGGTPERVLVLGVRHDARLAIR